MYVFFHPLILYYTIFVHFFSFTARDGFRVKIILTNGITGYHNNVCFVLVYVIHPYVIIPIRILLQSWLRQSWKVKVRLFNEREWYY